MQNNETRHLMMMRSTYMNVYMYTNICLLIKAANDLMILRRN